MAITHTADESIEAQIEEFWDGSIIPTLTEFMRIPNESPAFDREWKRNGHMDRAVELVHRWIADQKLRNCTVELLRDGQRTPVILAVIEGQAPGTVLLYGHLDKQPPMEGWREGLGPWDPVLDRQGRLYGRGGADDGYSAFAAVAAIKALQEQGLPHGRLVVLIECSEESGSPDLSHYMNAYRDRIGTPEFIVCLDSGCGNYEQLWCTTSLRGLVMGSIHVGVLSEGVHSGMAGGIVPSPMRVLRRVLDRLEDGATGRILPPGLQVEIPEIRREQARQAADVLGASIAGDFPFLEGARPESDSTEELILNSSWRSALAITAQEGLPAWGQGGNVLLPYVKVKLSLRIPPTLDPGKAAAALKQALETDPPHGAQVSVSAGGMPGWEAPPTAPWLETAMNRASRAFFGKDACYFGAGGTIPFMAMMGRQYPHAQFLITGVLGPHSNAHGPNEFLHVPYAKKLTCCLASVLAQHANHAME